MMDINRSIKILQLSTKKVFPVINVCFKVVRIGDNT